MKKKLGALILAVSALAITAACASSGAKVPITEESWTKAAPSQLPSRPARPAAAPTREAR